MTQSGSIYRLSRARPKDTWGTRFIRSIVSDTHDEPENTTGRPLIGLIVLIIGAPLSWWAIVYFCGPPVAHEWHLIHQGIVSGFAQLEYDLAASGFVR